MVLDDDSNPELIVSSFFDITERKQAEKGAKQHQAETIRVSHLTAVGEMASGIAHELNQPLCAISSYATACINTLESGQFKPEDLRTDLQVMATQAQRAGEIIRRVRGFLKKRDPEMIQIDISDLVERSLRLVSSEIDRCGISSGLELSDTVPMVWGDQIQIEQVLVNLIQNAVDAMMDVPANQRQLTIRTQEQSNRVVEIAVCDNGIGLNDGISEKVFDAFFTTKEKDINSFCRSERFMRTMFSEQICFFADVDLKSLLTALRKGAQTCAFTVSITIYIGLPSCP